MSSTIKYDISKRKKFVNEIKNEFYDMPLSEKKNLFLKKPNIDYSKLQISMIGRYSIMRENDAQLLIKIIHNHIKSYDIIITDATGGVGGSSIYLIDKFMFVKTVEINKFHQNIIKNNINVYGFTNHKLYTNDYISIMNKLKQDVIIMDPPWGGKDYKYKTNLNLFMDGINVIYLINELFKNDRCKLFVLFIPFNYDLNKFKKEIEYQYKVINNKFIKIYK
jgi:tRNA/tmRNA/rRNA uracil-C5-methylase (TrmA/RlmC/RlmD family)